MLTTRLVALTAACSLVSLPAAASPYSMNFGTDNPAYGPAGTHEVVVVESVPATPAPPPAPAAVVVTAGPEVQPYADPSTTTVIVTAPPVQAAPPPAPVRPPPPPKRGLGLMIAGFSMFGTAYLLTAWSGALTYDGMGGCGLSRYECREFGKKLMIPFIGPALGMEHTGSARETLGLLMVSGIQIATFMMGVVGAVRYSRWKRWERNFAGIPLGKKGLALTPIPRFDGAALGLNYRF